MLGVLQIGIAFEQCLRDATRLFQNFRVTQFRDFQIGQTRLARAEKLAGPAQFQIFFREQKTVLRRFDHAQAVVRDALFFLREQ